MDISSHSWGFWAQWWFRGEAVFHVQEADGHTQQEEQVKNSGIANSQCQIILFHFVILYSNQRRHPNLSLRGVDGNYFFNVQITHLNQFLDSSIQSEIVSVHNCRKLNEAMYNITL